MEMEHHFFSPPPSLSACLLLLRISSFLFYTFTHKYFIFNHGGDFSVVFVLVNGTILSTGPKPCP